MCVCVCVCVLGVGGGEREFGEEMGVMSACWVVRSGKKREEDVNTHAQAHGMASSQLYMPHRRFNCPH